MAQNNKAKLNTGAEIPLLGLGTWQDKGDQYDAVKTALKHGYRHIDTARIYGTEPEVGRAIKDSGISRNELFITTKLWNNKHHPDDVEAALDESLKDLGTDYVDLFLIHWPSAFKRGDDMFPKDSNDKTVAGDTNFVQTWKAMEQLPKSKVKAVGISNFAKVEVERLLKETSTVPAVHQLELHPWLQQKDFVAFNQSKGIHVTAYSPFGNQNAIYGSGGRRLIEEPVLGEIGKKHGVTGAQVALAWGVTQNVSVIPKSKTEKRIQDNFAGDFKLDEEDMKKIASLDKKMRFNDSSDDFGYKFFVDLDGKK